MTHSIKYKIAVMIGGGILAAIFLNLMESVL
jgi:hypothetical protein